MMTNKGESKLEQAKGNVKETVGNATNNKELENEGKADKASGKVNEKLMKQQIKQKTLLTKLKIN